MGNVETSASDDGLEQDREVYMTSSHISSSKSLLCSLSSEQGTLGKVTETPEREHQPLLPYSSSP